MKYIVEISDTHSHSFKVALNLPAQLKDAKRTNSESYWHALDEGYIAVRSGRCGARKVSRVVTEDDLLDEYDGWVVFLNHLIAEGATSSEGTVVLYFNYMFDFHEKVRSSGAGELERYGTKMKNGPIEWIIIK